MNKNLRLENVKIRTLKMKDFDDIYNLRVDLAKERTFVIYHKIPRKEIYRKIFIRMLRKAKNNDAIYLVSEINKKVVGLCAVERKEGDVKSHIGWLYIWLLKNYRSRGVGTSLMKKMLKVAKKYFKIIRLDVAVDNKVARKLYTKLGFKSECLLKKEYFMKNRYHDALIMSYYF